MSARYSAEWYEELRRAGARVAGGPPGPPLCSACERRPARGPDRALGLHHRTCSEDCDEQYEAKNRY